jgi:ABC-type multidrug transport system ATPase subunit
VDNVVRVETLAKSYGPIRALDGVSFQLGKGSVIGLLGSNGAGKTTTFKCMLGVTSFDGEVEIGGVSVRKRGKQARALVGYLPQAPVFNTGDTCRQVLDFFADLKALPAARTDALLEKVDLAGRADAKVGELSGGMRQRLALAVALLGDPPLLLLDEPTASLDAESRRRFHDLLGQLKDEGKTVVLSTHFLDSLGGLADRIILLKQGRVIFDGTPHEFAGATGRRVLVNLNGTDYADFVRAAGAAGIGPERITPAVDLDEAFASATAEEETK